MHIASRKSQEIVPCHPSHIKVSTLNQAKLKLGESHSWAGTTSKIFLGTWFSSAWMAALHLLPLLAMTWKFQVRRGGHWPSEAASDTRLSLSDEG